MEPIKPEEVIFLKEELFDSEMIQAVNELLAIKYDGYSATLRQDDIIKQYFIIKGVEQTPKLRQDLYKRHQLDFEEIYRKNGWKVTYDKPGYNENYEPTFEFSVKKKKNEK